MPLLISDCSSTAWLLENNKSIDDAQFAERPFGTGPYKFYSNLKSDGNAPREMVFLDNPMYGRGRDDRGNLPTLPNIKEIRLVEVAKVHNLIESFQQGEFAHPHRRADGGTRQIHEPVGGFGREGATRTPLSANRRIHMLAVEPPAASTC